LLNHTETLETPNFLSRTSREIYTALLTKLRFPSLSRDLLQELSQMMQFQEEEMRFTRWFLKTLFERLNRWSARLDIPMFEVQRCRNHRFLLTVIISPREGREMGYVRVRIDHLKFSERMLRYGLYVLTIKLMESQLA
ncbi:hypothetical protein MKX01_036219, partial [Papaver californicum]